MHAAILRDRGAAWSVESVGITGPGVGQVLVRIAGTGFCHTDTVLRAPGFARLPVIGGHEGAGVVEAVGPNVSSPAVGDHVVLSFDWCGSCRNCERDHPAYCVEFGARNLSGWDADDSPQVTDTNGRAVGNRWFQQSSFASHVLAPARSAVVVDRDLPLELMGPLGCGVQTGAGAVLSVLRPALDTALLITGAGAVGLSAVMAARMIGVRSIVVCDRHPHRLELARELGATQLVSADGELPPVDNALDTTGSPAVIAATITAVRPPGVVGLVGIQQGDVTIRPLDISAGRGLVGILEGCWHRTTSWRLTPDAPALPAMFMAARSPVHGSARKLWKHRGLHAVTTGITIIRVLPVVVVRWSIRSADPECVDHRLNGRVAVSVGQRRFQRYELGVRGDRETGPVAAIGSARDSHRLQGLPAVGREPHGQRASCRPTRSGRPAVTAALTSIGSTV
ncbi:alcohol dehydrogenase catalytic domain-containing protein [Kribbella sp. NPDC056861]|uniref:alcohol dehydrogenase catalytic domain-containing protein n=1 Tax=Kribbella sp. NPDC056861 TaxID=3154857 RepID=UPI00341DCFBC